MPREYRHIKQYENEILQLKSDLSKIAKMVYNNLNTQIFSFDDVYIEGISSGEVIVFSAVNS